MSKKISTTDWITQSEASRLRGVSRQAINKLVKAGKVRTLLMAGVLLVHKQDIEEFEAAKPGRPKKSEA
ncbi:MAG: hypothetical protein ABI599_15320 [Flavobacteriales bacterium]